MTLPLPRIHDEEVLFALITLGPSPAQPRAIGASTVKVGFATVGTDDFDLVNLAAAGGRNQLTMDDVLGIGTHDISSYILQGDDPNKRM